MIRHIVLFTAKNKAEIDGMVDGLSVLTAIPHARLLEIARNRKTDPLSDEIDVVVYGEFDNDAELAAYKAHHLYREAIERVRPLRELRFAADYDSAKVAPPVAEVEVAVGEAAALAPTKSASVETSRSIPSRAKASA